MTPKQVLFFKPVMEELESRGHKVLATSRHYREVEQLAPRVGIPLSYFGHRGGKEPVDQLRASLERMSSLLPAVYDFRPDLAVSVASSDCARIAFGIKVPHVAVNDSPHSVVAGKLALTLSSHLLCPWIIPYSDWYGFGLSKDRITRYRALDPAAWLKREPATRGEPSGGPSRRKRILVRLEESYAPYMAGTDSSWSTRLLERLVSEFGEERLVVLCRYQEQLDQVKKRFGGSVEVPETVVDGASAIRGSDLFIGMGGTMTTEAALLGVPTISAYQGSDLYTEKYLLSKELIMKTTSLDQLVRYARKGLDPDYRARCSRKARRVLDSMEDPVGRVVEYLVSQRAV